jgi:kynureninase
MAHQNPFSFERSQVRRTDAWRLLHGTPSIPALYAAKPGVHVINEVGISAIREKSQRQTGRLLDLANREGFPCTAPSDPARRGGTVAINVEHAYEISQSLKALDILCDFRPGAGIRFSPHFYNLDSELDAAIEAIREIRSSGAWRAFAAGSSAVT